MLVGDEAEFGPQALSDRFGHALGVAPRRALPGQPFQRLLGGLAIADGFFGIVVAQLVEAEADAGEQALRFGQGIGMVGKQPRHFARWLEVSLGVGREAPAGGLERHALADAGHHIMQHAAPGLVVEDVIGGQQGNA